MKRKHFSDDQQKQLLDEWRMSGLTGKQFTESRSLAAGSLWRWRKRWNADAAAGGFKPVLLRANAEPSTTSASEHIVAEISSGAVKVKLFAGIDNATLAHLISALRGIAP